MIGKYVEIGNCNAGMTWSVYAPVIAEVIGGTQYFWQAEDSEGAIWLSSKDLSRNPSRSPKNSGAKVTWWREITETHLAPEWSYDDRDGTITTKAGRFIANVVCMTGENRDIANRIGMLMAASQELLAATEATLLFHNPEPWDATKRKRWKELTGCDDASTKALCDLQRKAYRKAIGTADEKEG